MRWSRSAWVGLAVALAAFAVRGTEGVRAQSAPPGTLQVFSRLSIEDVTVTDAGGRPVRGLQKEDFTLLEDGKPQDIRNFEEVTAAYVPEPTQLPKHVYSNVPMAPASSAVNILLLDFVNEAPIDATDQRQISHATQTQHMVKLAAIQAIDAMPAGTRMAALAMTDSLHLLQSFTTDKELLKAAINAVPYDLEGHGDGQCIQSDSRNRSVLESFDQIAASTAPLRVRKNLIWFTVGIPEITDPNYRRTAPVALTPSNKAGAGNSGDCQPDYTHGLDQAYTLLREAQVAVYPIYARGVDRLGAAQLSMEAVAEATGGVAYSGTNDIATQVGKALDNGASYYSLAYIPEGERYDGKLHKVEIKLKQTGLTLVYRKNYFADDPAKIKMKPGLTLTTTPPPAYGGNMKAPMSRGLPTATDLLFEVGVEPSTAAAKPGEPAVLGTLDERLKGKRLVRYGFQFVLPAKQITFKDGPKGTHKGELDFDIAVYDAQEKLLTGLSQTVKMPVSDDVYQQLIKGPFRFFQQLDIPLGQGPLFVRVGVLDPTSDKVGTLELPLNLGKNGQVKSVPTGNTGE